MSEKVGRWLLTAALISAALLALVLLLLWSAGQMAGTLADHWPAVAYPVGAFGELVAILTHPRSTIATDVPTIGFWVCLAGELGAVIATLRWIRRRRAQRQAKTWRPPTVLQGGAGSQPGGFVHAYDQIAARDAQR